MTSTFFCVKGQSKIRVDFHFFFFLENKTLHPALFGGSYLFGVCVYKWEKRRGWDSEMMSFDLITLSQCVCVCVMCVRGT